MAGVLPVGGEHDQGAVRWPATRTRFHPDRNLIEWPSGPARLEVLQQTDRVHLGYAQQNAGNYASTGATCALP